VSKKHPTPSRVVKGRVGAPRTPETVGSALAVAGMDGSSMMGPGRPLNPWSGYSQRPRAMDYPNSVNISTRSRGSWGRTGFDTLRSVIDTYDIARACINHKIDEIRSMEPMFLPQDGVKGDLDSALDAARAALAFPDRDLPYDAWVSKWLENALRYDAAPLYHRRNFDGEIIGLESIDGTTISPYIDEHGRRPQAPSPAFYQVIKGQVWNWFTSDDMVYTPFRPQADSPYGLAPMESLLITANTDIRFQWHFLQMFTDGSIPGGFVELPPDISSPDQVAEWQDYWDAMVLGDQAKLHQVIAVPNGTKFQNSRPVAFDKTFPEFLASRTAMAYGVVPQDLGIVQDVNRANGETQTDIQFRVNTLPWVQYVQGHLTRYLQNGLGLPVKIVLDTGRNKEDRLNEAKAWEVYIQNGLASPDEARSELLGLPIDNENPMQRFVFTARGGPIPVSAFQAVSGPTDSETYSPLAGSPLPHKPFALIEGVAPQKPPDAEPLAVQRYPAENAASVVADMAAAAAPVLKSQDEEAAFGRFVKARFKAGKWRDFQFTTVTPLTAHRLNDAGRAAVRKSVGEITVAGLCVRAADTGRVLMLQRALDEDDLAGGMWEFPGGHVEDGEVPLDAAKREWTEETGLDIPEGFWTGSWSASNACYGGFVLTVPSEALLDVLAVRDFTTNPDDPDGDLVEALAWWDPATLEGNPSIRTELATDLPLVLAALNPIRKAITNDPRWATHPVRAVENKLAAYHGEAFQSAFGDSVSHTRLRALVTAYTAQLPRV
jgi:8-oxo-dGTP pyrophosphatase MutT (NUDIX family)